MDHLTHEKLDVYQSSIEFVELSSSIIQQLPKGKAYLADQLHRAATSVALNIAEGAGEFARSEKARFYRIAKRSATECAAVIDVCHKLGIIQNIDHTRSRSLLIRVISMLTKLIKTYQPE